MHLSVKRVAAVAAGALLALGLAGSASGAQQTWTVSPGGLVEGFAEEPWAELERGSTVTCEQAIAEGEAKSGSGLAGEKIAEVTTVIFESPSNPDGDCTGPSNILVKIHPEGEPWYLNAVDVDPNNPDIVRGTLTSDAPNGITATVNANDGCDADVGGLDADGNPEPGYIEGIYDNAAGELTATGGNLAVVDLDDGQNGRPDECDPTLVERNERINLHATFLIDPHQDIHPD